MFNHVASPHNSLEGDVRSRVHSPADAVVGCEGEDVGPTSGPHRPAVLCMKRLAQTHDGRVDVSHCDSFNWLPDLLLQGEEYNNPNVTHLQLCFRMMHIDSRVYLEHRVLINSQGSIGSPNQQVILSLTENHFKTK